MRIVSCLVLLLSVLMFATAGFDEYRGTTRIQVRRGPPEIIAKTNDPKLFHNAMTYHWAYGLLVLIGGLIAFMVDAGLEKSDPFSPEFAGNKALDDWSDDMKKEEERRKHPMR